MLFVALELQRVEDAPCRVQKFQLICTNVNPDPKSAMTLCRKAYLPGVSAELCSCFHEQK